MTKRSPTAASLTKPQYRQRVKDGRAKCLPDKWTAAAWRECTDTPAQLEGWQEPPAKHCPTVAELRVLAAQADVERGGIDLGQLSPDELTSWLASVQADGWQEPLRQMEG